MGGGIGTRRSTRRAAATLLLGVTGLGAVGALHVGRGAVAVPGLVAWTRGARFLPESGGVRQRRANDCGPAALAHALRMLGVRARYPDPATELDPGPGGCRLDEIACEAERLGAAARLRKLDPSAIDSVAAPAVLHLVEGHFVAYEGRSPEGGVLVHDPSLGRLEQSPRSLARHWSGWVLELDLPGKGRQ